MGSGFVLMLLSDQNVCLQSLIALYDESAVCKTVEMLRLRRSRCFDLFVWLCAATSSRRSDDDLI